MENSPVASNASIVHKATLNEIYDYSGIFDDISTIIGNISSPVEISSLYAIDNHSTNDVSILNDTNVNNADLGHMDTISNFDIGIEHHQADEQERIDVGSYSNLEHEVAYQQPNDLAHIDTVPLLNHENDASHQQSTEFSPINGAINLTQSTNERNDNNNDSNDYNFSQNQNVLNSSLAALVNAVTSTNDNFDESIRVLISQRLRQLYEHEDENSLEHLANNIYEQCSQGIYGKFFDDLLK